MSIAIYVFSMSHEDVISAFKEIKEKDHKTLLLYVMALIGYLKLTALYFAAATIFLCYRGLDYRPLDKIISRKINYNKSTTIEKTYKNLIKAYNKILPDNHMIIIENKIIYHEVAMFTIILSFFTASAAIYLNFSYYYIYDSLLHQLFKILIKGIS